MKPLYRIREACEILTIGRSLLYQLIGSGRIQTIKIEGATRIPRSSIEAFLQECERDAAIRRADSTEDPRGE